MCKVGKKSEVDIINKYDSLQKVFIEFMDKEGYLLQYEQSSTNGDGLRNVTMPFDVGRFTPEKPKMRIFATDRQDEEIKDYNFISYLAKRDEISENLEYERKIDESIALRGLPKDYFRTENDLKFPKLRYEDVTEQDLFGYEAIPDSDLRADNKGVLGDCGLRKIEISFKDWNFSKLLSADAKVKASLYWNEMDKISLDNIFEEEIRYDKEVNKFIVYIDTNKLGDAIEENKSESQHPKFTGRFELHFISNNEKIVYGFPVELVVKNTRINDSGKNPFLKDSVVSIDFGTSSTCAAINAQGKNRLLTLSGIHKRFENDDNAYENPTNLMIYNWKEVFRQWDKINDNCPFFITKSNEVDELLADYDSGYTVQDEYKLVDEQDGHRKMQAILMQLKMIPYLIVDGVETKFIPYDDEKRSPIIVVDNVESEDGLHFDPIAFYGYLLGRAINNPISGELYRKYQITYPSKFNAEIREKIRASLEYGIKRALPWSIREAKDKKGKDVVTVTMDFSEPEACMGAVVGTQLKLEGANVKLFAVYDLGGGTMDFAFGMLRQAEEEEVEEADEILQFLGIDGDEKIGGEKLIHQLAYKIYLENKETVKELGIKFVIPKGELKPQGFEGLLSDGDEIANTNLNIIKEKLARPLFKYTSTIDDLNDIFNTEEIGEDRIKSLDVYSLKLRNRDNEAVEVDLKVTDIDEFLSEKIEKTIKAFQDSMVDIFKRNVEILKKYGISEFKESDVEIFLGGHASKQHFVTEKLKEYFPDNKIQRVGDGQNDESLSDEYGINEKTAVAFGQLKLDNGLLKVLRPGNNETRPPFMFNVGYINNENKFERVIAKNENSTDWKRANRVSKINEMINLYYTTSPNDDRNSLKPLEYSVSDFMEDKKLTLYIRIADERSIEFRLGTRNEAPNNDEGRIDSMVIRLKE